jgi:hypothetical protein
MRSEAEIAVPQGLPFDSPGAADIRCGRNHSKSNPSGACRPFMASFVHENFLLSLLRGEARGPFPGAIEDPSAFVELCRRHRVASLVYQAVSRGEGALPPEILAALRETARKTLVDNLIPSEGRERYYQEMWYHQLVETPDSPSCYVEFHWNLESVERSRIDPEELIRDALACEIEGERFLRLCDEHLLIHLAVHLAHHHDDPSLHWVEDLRRLLALGKLDWKRVGSTARMWGVENCLAYSLGYVEKVFPGAVPGPGRRFTLSPLRSVILRGLRSENPTLPHRPLEGSALRHLVSMSLLDRWLDVARYVASHSVSRVARSLGVSRVMPPGRSRDGTSLHPANRERGGRRGSSRR